MNQRKRFLSLMLVFAMVLSLTPATIVSVYAEPLPEVESGIDVLALINNAGNFSSSGKGGNAVITAFIDKLNTEGYQIGYSEKVNNAKATLTVTLAGITVNTASEVGLKLPDSYSFTRVEFGEDKNKTKSASVELQNVIVNVSGTNSITAANRAVSGD